MRTTLLRCGSSSKEWLKRQATDPYVKAAMEKGYRARSAFKLIEMNGRYGFIKPGMTVVDCGAAPGSWTQVAVDIVRRGNSSGTVVGCDLLHMDPVEGATLLPYSDFTLPSTQEEMKRLMGEAKLADVVMSDMAPNASGCGALDHDAIVKLCYSVLRFGALNSNIGATFLCKIWAGAGQKRLTKDLERFFESVVDVKPKSSRSHSAEMYLLARKFRGIEKSAIKQ